MSSIIIVQSEPDTQHVSESVYLGLCRVVGTSQQVAMRRDLLNITELLWNRTKTNDENTIMTTGSKREGFRMKGSDEDTMFWQNDHRVIWELFQIQFYKIGSLKVILSDGSRSPPGYTLLYLLSPSTYKKLQAACVTINNTLYLSSSRYRQVMCSAINPNSKIHGPCGSGSIGTLEYDNAPCFACDFWPPSASSWIDRCLSWPSPNTVHEILQNGCHFAPIGHKSGDHEIDEWRISFALAEQKLVRAMDHCQFLTYGLLKLFLKEVINNGLSDGDTSLSSYHMKTAVFWVIQQNTMSHWCPKNLLECFWVCFKLILKWVYEGACPNFFIPKNNMFLGKIYGKAQIKLFTRLYAMYENGVKFSVLQIESIRPYVINVFENPTLSICTDEQTLISEIEFDLELFTEIRLNDAMFILNLHHCMKYLQTVEQLIQSPLTQFQIVMLQKRTATFLQRLAFILHNLNSTHLSTNKLMYVTYKMCRLMLIVAAHLGYVSDMLYIATYFYMTFRYKEALSLIDLTKMKLAQPHIIYNKNVQKERYTEAVGGQSWSTKLRRAVARDIKFDNEINYINELILEQQACVENVMPSLCIPPLVQLHFLEVLCCRHVDTMRAQTALHNLQVLVHQDQEINIPSRLRDISWQILGICEQLTGNLLDALYSYQQSFKQYPYHEIQKVSIVRIIIIIFRLLEVF
ncbi:uncharacterized protein LOC133197058 [Saccostrea echinata]|uniref:uncharacterized protein LOC133197058 n=1 Tax=Saccostrea echinata TaxID=191078 RepID=UPI002A810CF5|nr:uncharacterized protein LOC133197058 [Saccostrea echinata]